ncbi:PRC-barrel domain-containing protein [Noviherbaspirillum aerium]|uniref:PRC-barrel domain-containing protein n=1 Tax=Noviherbaspirillum aerium TaxID=2588497 RepID=UPI00124EB15B|nr:PRC-barrel domain-containing protein [Noviherbaspirillum aerium]
MLHSLKALDGFAIMTSEGLIGKVKDIYFDDHQWVVRYLEVNTGGWLSGRHVLISPVSVLGVDWNRQEVMVRLSRAQVKDSPGRDTAMPVSRQEEALIANHYSYPYYWSGPYIWGATAMPMMVSPAMINPLPAEEPGNDGHPAQPDGDPHLRSKDEVVGYRIEASDDQIGHVEDFLFDDRDWSISHMIVDTRNWWPGKQVLISPRRIRQVDWAERRVVVGLSRAEVEQSAEYQEKHSPSARYDEVYRHAKGFSEMPPFTPADAVAGQGSRRP